MRECYKRVSFVASTTLIFYTARINRIQFHRRAGTAKSYVISHIVLRVVNSLVPQRYYNVFFNKLRTHANVKVHELFSWWRQQVETFPALLAICERNSSVPGEFPAERPVTWNFDVFFELRLNKRLSKQSWGWWFETLSRPLWRHCNVVKLLSGFYHRRPLIISQHCFR